MQDRLYNMLIQKDEITWQNIIYDLVNSEQMDPWDIDVSLLSKRYLEAIQELKEHNFFISGKILLASAILLKLKSHRLLTEYIANFDNQLFQRDEEILEGMEDLEQQDNEKEYGLLIKTPYPRKKKVSLNDLMKALHKALDVDERRKTRRIGERLIREAEIPIKKFDITDLIKGLYEKIKVFFIKKEKITFAKLVNSDRKEDKILTFIPLLHLAHQQKVELEQEVPFGEIEISMPKND